MAHRLKNKNLEIHIDLPDENYNFSRFDWSGKITAVKFQNKLLTIAERTDIVNDAAIGKGFYNEFGIDTALGFEETAIGGWFHKIGVGLLKKKTEEYFFHKKHQIKPAEFKVDSTPNEIGFKGTPREQFFFSNLSGGENVDASWELLNLKHKIGISETGSFRTNKVNLWGWKHAISPELFFHIFIQPGESTKWSRTYRVNHLK